MVVRLMSKDQKLKSMVLEGTIILGEEEAYCC